ncbi:septum formation initiator family protein [Nocardia huaxiensis]|uniref:Septum formation initiator family protein n=1 Tax=Nocardia huaxiensis TaxID=2755382 RepID=A0A7D6ZJK5_9NOCA|nr:septum formation initiator family protein [Nocardia huaxiensis]QLY32599.1 septum formation initiator family protein [Nocardia huaxiensis]
MTERRARGSSPAGRGDRRPSRPSKARAGRGKPGGSDSARTSAGQRAAQRRAGKSAKTARHDRKILGMSTGRAVLLAAVLCGLALTLAVPLRTYFTQRAESAELAAQREQLQDDVARLRDRRAQQQDPNYIKTEARDRLRLVMPGETPYIVQVPSLEQPAVPSYPAKTRVPDPWYTELWRSISSPQPSGPATDTAQEGQPR